MRKCPFCAEEIMEEAVKCRFCGEFLDDNLRKAAGQKPKWYSKTSTLLISFLIIGPFMIPLLWFNPRYSSTKKIILSLIILVISYMLYEMLKTSVTPISEYYQMIEGQY